MTSTTTSSAGRDLQAEPGAYYSALANTYEAAFGHDAGLLKFLQKVLTTHLPPNASVLDIGCGTGSPVARSLSAAGHNVTGIDISEEMVRLSRMAVPEGNFEVADMRGWSPPAGKVGAFDAVFLMLSLFVLSREEIEALVAKCAGWLKNGSGVLCVGSIAAEDCKPERYDEEDDWGKYCARDIPFRFMGDQVKITLLTRDGWKRSLGKNGLEIVDELTELFVPPAEAKSDEEIHYFFVGRKAK
ncbi:MAG: hypothetical protein Q9227_007387 [Pyrenula ochraceoflavens]